MKTCPVCDTPFPDQHSTCPTDGAVLIETRELDPGRIVRGKYRIVSKLGQGGMGSVYLAEHLLLGGQMALKFLAVELSRNPQFVKRFRNEARVAYQLRHPNIVEVADLDQDEDGSLFIAMEYVPGPSLRTMLRELKAPLPIGRAVQIARGVAAGLAAAHARGAVHRDIKPENILLGVQATGEVLPKVLDFGIAAMTENITNSSSTRGLLLTPEYASPEQWRGTPASELDGRADLYALGCVLYEMLAGRQPFHAVSPEGWMFQHLQATPEPIENLRPDLAGYPGLGTLVTRLIAREREQRFPSAAALLEALGQIAGTATAKSQPAMPAVNPPPAPAGTPAIPGSAATPPVNPSGSTLQGSDVARPASRKVARSGKSSLAVAGAVGAIVVAIALAIVLWVARAHREPPPQPVAQTALKPIAPASAPTFGAAGNAGSPVSSATTPAPATPAIDRTANTPPPAAPAKAPGVTITPEQAEGLILVKSVPQYPPIARAAHISGTVLLKATISRTGTIEELRVVSGPPMLRQAAIDSVKTWRYRPYILDGKPVEARTTIAVAFKIKG